MLCIFHVSTLQYRESMLTRLLQAQDSTQSGPKDNVTDDTTVGSATGTASLKMSDKQVRDEIMAIFFAGHETTDNALTWTFYLLSQNREIEKKLVEELESVFDIDGTPTVEDIPKLKFTEKVLRESMRLYPPAWSLASLVPLKIKSYLERLGDVRDKEDSIENFMALVAIQSDPAKFIDASAQISKLGIPLDKLDEYLQNIKQRQVELSHLDEKIKAQQTEKKALQKEVEGMRS